MKTFLVLLAFIVATLAQNFQAGVYKIDLEIPLGVPLAGYNHGQRRVPYWPIPYPGQYTTFMTGNVGVLDPVMAKALVIDNGSSRFAFVTIDAIGSDGSVSDLAYNIAVEMGFSLPRSNVIFSGSHSHSGPGAISPEFLWEMAPATDLLVPELQKAVCTRIAKAMVQAEKNLGAAKIDFGVYHNMTGFTTNRRAPNPWVQRDTIDPNLGVIRVDKSDGTPLATVWNFAIHGVCYGPDNMKLSADIMGAVNANVESLVGGVSMFMNADAGDIDPAGDTCGPCGVVDDNPLCKFTGAPKMAAVIQQVRNSLQPTNSVQMSVVSQIVPFGPTNLNITLERFSNCSTGGPLDICTICAVIGCDANLHLDDGWVEENPRFTAMKFIANGKSTVFVTVPGEPLIELGWLIRNDTQRLGFDQTFLLGYSNNHMGYFATPNEYDWGGYESQLTFWGIDTAEMVRQGCYSVASQL